MSSPADKCRRYGAINLPLTRSNEGLLGDVDYVNSATEQVDDLMKYTTIGANTRILDFGCGQGRFANGLLARSLEISKYCGVDTQLESVNWCRKWIGEGHPAFEFVHLSAHNARYNANAELRPRLPVESNAYDVAFVNSVFSHMLAEDVAHYLSEIRRALDHQGVLYLTAFLEEGVPEVEENPDGYLGRTSTGPLHRVRFEMSYFFGLMEAAGFEVVGYRHNGIERTMQSVVVARKH